MSQTRGMIERGRARRSRQRLVAAVACAWFLVFGTVAAAGTAGAAVSPDLPPLGGPTLAADAVAAGTDYTPLAPARLADTRLGKVSDDGLYQGGFYPIMPASPLDVVVGGRSGVPSSGVEAVALNVTVTGAQGPGYVTVYPSGEARPTASNLNYVGYETVANSVVAKLGPDNSIRLYTSAPANMIVDVVGYFTSGGIEPLSPARLADTRPNGITTDGQYAKGGAVSSVFPLSIPVVGRGGVAAGATAVALNVTAVGGTGEGYLTVYPYGSPRPGASTINYTAGQVIANSVIAKVGGLGQVSIYNSNKLVHVVVDVAGYFTADSTYVPLSPARFADTRSSGRTVAGRPGPYTADRDSTGVGPIGSSSFNGDQIDVLVSGRGGVPLTDTGAVVLNVTVTQPTGSGYLSVFPLDTERPTSSSVNFSEGRSVPNMVIAKVGRGGGVSIFSSVPNSHIIVDVLGYFPGRSTADVDGQWASIGREDLDMPLVYDRCFPITYRINPAGAQTGWIADVDSSIAQIEAATGIDFVKGPNTTEVPSTSREPFDQNGYPSPVLVAFPTPTTVGELSGSVIGYGGSSAAGYGDDVRWMPTQFFSGFAYFDSTESLAAGFGSGNTFGKVALHELGHVVGLGHVANTDELMNAFLVSRAGGYGTGDTFGLGLLYRTQGCTGSPATFDALGAGGGKSSDITRDNVRTITAVDAFGPDGH